MNEKRKRILKMLEEGHITAEEADSLLETLDDQQGKSEFTKTENNEEQKKSIQDSIKSFTEGIFNIIDETVQKVKEGTFTFGSSHIDVERNFTFLGNDVRFLNCDLSNASVKILPSDDDFIRIEMNGKVYKETDQKIAEKLFDKYVSVHFTNDSLNIEQDRKTISINMTIYLPRKSYEQAYLKTVNGSFTIKSSYIKVARISSINGSIKLSDYKGDALYTETKHGSLRLDQIEVSKIKAETVTGSLYVDGMLEHLDGDVVTGSIKVFIRNKDAEQADLKTTTGSIKLSIPNEMLVKGEASSNFGGIDIQIPRMTISQLENQAFKRYYEFQNFNNSDDYFEVDLSTKTGSINISTLY